MTQLTERETELLVAGVRMQLDEAEKMSGLYDSKLRKMGEEKVIELYALWEKIGELYNVFSELKPN